MAGPGGVSSGRVGSAASGDGSGLGVGTRTVVDRRGRTGPESGGGATGVPSDGRSTAGGVGAGSGEDVATFAEPSSSHSGSSSSWTWPTCSCCRTGVLRARTPGAPRSTGGTRTYTGLGWSTRPGSTGRTEGPSPSSAGKGSSSGTVRTGPDTIGTSGSAGTDPGPTGRTSVGPRRVGRETFWTTPGTSAGRGESSLSSTTCKSLVWASITVESSLSRVGSCTG